MKNNIFLSTFETVKATASLHEAALVSFSGGKDSLVVLDICSKYFRKVVCFYMYLIHGLEVVEKQLDYVRQKYNVEVLQYPHWSLSHFLRDGIYCNNYYTLDNLPELKIKDIWEVAREQTGIELIVTGQRRSDDPFRWLMLSKNVRNVKHFVKDWHRYDVMAYLKINNITMPDSQQAEKSGIDLSEKSLLWLYDNYPADFKKLCAVFPYAEAVVYRRTWYGSKL